MIFQKAPDIQKEISILIRKLNFNHLKENRIVSFRSKGSKSRAQARIWSFPHIWQQALDLPAYYCIEVLSEKFDRLSRDDQVKILIHELLHIPKNFSGALLPHRQKNRKIDTKEVERFFKMIK